jgi:hypothetical protein
VCLRRKTNTLPNIKKVPGTFLSAQHPSTLLAEPATSQAHFVTSAALPVQSARHHLQSAAPLVQDAAQPFKDIAHPCKVGWPDGKGIARSVKDRPQPLTKIAAPLKG